MYSVQNNIAYINGQNGIYDGVVKNSSVRYGRNAADNNMKYLADYTKQNDAVFPDLKGLHNLSNDEFEAKMNELQTACKKSDAWLNSLPPLKFEYRYMPNSDSVDTQALMGAAYEEMGQKTEIKTSELTAKIQEAFGNNATAEAVDLNKDGNIDLGEYSASILLSDIMSDENPSLNGANGVITDEGQDKIIPYASKRNYNIAYKTYSAIYQSYDLKSAQEEFLKDDNNMA